MQCPEVRLYVKVCPKTDGRQNSRKDNDIAETSGDAEGQAALSLCSRHACMLKAADIFIFTLPHHQ